MAENKPEILYDDNDHSLTVEAVDSAGAAIAGATCTVTLLDTLGAELAGETWPLSVPETATPGTYQVLLSHNIVLVPGQVIADIIFDGGAGKYARYKPRINVQTRRYV